MYACLPLLYCACTYSYYYLYVYGMYIYRLVCLSRLNDGMCQLIAQQLMISNTTNTTTNSNNNCINNNPTTTTTNNTINSTYNDSILCRILNKCIPIPKYINNIFNELCINLMVYTPFKYYISICYTTSYYSFSTAYFAPYFPSNFKPEIKAENKPNLTGNLTTNLSRYCGIYEHSVYTISVQFLNKHNLVYNIITKYNYFHTICILLYTIIKEELLYYNVNTRLHDSFIKLRR